MIPFADIGNFSRRLPLQWIDKGGFDVNDEFVRYAMPLIDAKVEKPRFY